MIETEPKYFTEFRKGLTEELTREFGLLRKDIKEINEKIDLHSEDIKEIKSTLDQHSEDIKEIKDTLDLHFETIGEIKVEVTKTNILLGKKTNSKETKELEKRVEKLENAVFA